MSKRRRKQIVERIKSLLIVLLSCSAVYLLVLTQSIAVPSRAASTIRRTDPVSMGFSTESQPSSTSRGTSPCQSKYRPGAADRACRPGGSGIPVLF